MKKTRLILLLCALTAVAWSLPGLAQAKGNCPAPGAKISSMFDGGAAHPGSMFDGGSSFDGGSMFDGG
ncbi:MAG TPA: hypothetical protein VF063_09570 [Gaiellaceae bacterium]